MLTETLNSQRSPPNQGLESLLPLVLIPFTADPTLQVE